MEFLRTPDERFLDLPDYHFTPHYFEFNGLRIHFVDEGPVDAAPVLLLHGEPSWSFLYRKMIPIITAAGLRAIAPDLIGFGRSDKPINRSDYSYQLHVDAILALVDSLNLANITLCCQDWGGLIGLRVVAATPDKFARILAANTGLPTGNGKLPEAFFQWQEFSQTVPELPVGDIIQMGCQSKLAPEVIAAYQSPYPDERYKAGARAFPLLVPTRPDDPAATANQQAWQVLTNWQKPFLTAFGDSDPITRGAELHFQSLIPGAKGQPHTIIKKAGHFIQEDRGEELANLLVNFVVSTPAD